MPADVDVLTAALAYAAAGLYVLPVEPSSKHAGSVVGKGWPAKSSRDPAQIAAWFAGTNYGVAIHCGRSGLVAFDVDHPERVPDVLARHLDSAPCQSSRPDQPGRGHYVFATPLGRMFGNSTGQLGGAWGEVRGANGVIIAAPSPRTDGGEYRWIRTGALPVLPDEIAKLLPDSTDADAAASDPQVSAFLATHTAATKPGILTGLLNRLTDQYGAGASRHQATIAPLVGAMKESRAGYYSAQVAESQIRALFLAEVAKPPKSIHQSNPRIGPVAQSEFAGMLSWAVGQAITADMDEVRRRTEDKMFDAWAWIWEIGDTVITGAPTQTTNGDAHTPQVITPTEPADVALSRAHDTFREWLGAEFDFDALDAMLAATAVQHFDGEPLWLLLVSGSGNAKTETVQSLSTLPDAHIVSTIASEGALLSASAKRDRTKDATGGLLRQIGERGVLVIKDVTSILSMGRELRASVLAAIREVYDGKWVRTVGTDGGRRLEWAGRITVIGAVTTAWDTHHAVVAAMGDRFVLLRMDSTVGRTAAGRRAIRNTGRETEMRADLSAAVAAVIAAAVDGGVSLTDDETDRLLDAADLVTKARTAVEFDQRGYVEMAHAPEMPTRFAKQLAQVVRGGIAIGMDRGDAMRLAIRCARDSTPPLRLAILDHLASHSEATTADVVKAIDKPRTSVDRQLQALHELGVLTQGEAFWPSGQNKWTYSLAHGVDPSTLVVPSRSVTRNVSNCVGTK